MIVAEVKAGLHALAGWLTTHRHVAVYVVLAALMTWLFVRSDQNRSRIVENAEDSLLAICVAQQENRNLLRELVDFSTEGKLTHEQILEIEDRELRVLMLGLERRREELAELKDDLLPPIECERLDLRASTATGYGASP